MELDDDSDDNDDDAPEFFNREVMVNGGVRRLTPKCRLVFPPPTVKHTGQESGGEFYEFFKF